MEEFQLLQASKVSVNDFQVYFQVMMGCQDKDFQLELNFINETIEESKKGILKNFATKLNTFENSIEIVLENDFNNKGQVFSYIDSLSSKSPYQTLREKPTLISVPFGVKDLKLMRVALYPDGKYDKDYYATFDYAFFGDLSYPLIEVKTDESGNCKYLCWQL